MARKIFIFLIFVFCALFFAAMSFAKDTAAEKPAATDNTSIADKPSAPSHTLKGSDPAQGTIIGEPITEEEMLLNPVKKKKRAQKQEDIKDKK